MSTPNELQRWDQETNWDLTNEMVPQSDGRYALWSDIEPLIRSHEALREALEALDKAREVCEETGDWDAVGGLNDDEIWREGTAALAAAKEVGKLTRAARE